ncbi:hypothetical protein RP20_CCG004499 [Aedes albopictus]|nr:hypothetical protein RP20_CCG004499 [Aedes albopictus]
MSGKIATCTASGTLVHRSGLAGTFLNSTGNLRILGPTEYRSVWSKQRLYHLPSVRGLHFTVNKNSLVLVAYSTSDGDCSKT